MIIEVTEVTPTIPEETVGGVDARTKETVEPKFEEGWETLDNQ